MYALAHLANHLAALRGVEAHIALMQALRQVTRIPAVETLLPAVLIVAAFSGAFYAIGLPPAYRATSA